MKRYLDLTDDDIEIVRDAVRVLRELDTVRPAEMTSLFYASQYDNLQVVVRDLLRVLGVDPDA